MQLLYSLACVITKLQIDSSFFVKKSGPDLPLQTTCFLCCRGLSLSRNVSTLCDWFCQQFSFCICLLPPEKIRQGLQILNLLNFSCKKHSFLDFWNSTKHEDFKNITNYVNALFLLTVSNFEPVTLKIGGNIFDYKFLEFWFGKVNFLIGCHFLI